ncbi:MAG: single-stranded-DNA-specific exonuclease RecJ [bacterium]
MAAVPAKIWKTVPCDEAAAASLARSLAIPDPAARVLVARGFADATAAERFLNPRLSEVSDPFLLPGLDKAIARTWQAIERGESIVIYGDYDVDGITSTALMIRVLTRLGAKVQPFLPHRMDEGYGLSMDGISRCIAELNPRLIITVDCGTGSVEPVKAAAEQGIDVIVTDHHTPAGDVAPAVAVVNPKLGPEAGLHVLAGVGVAFKFCHALLKRGRDGGHRESSKLDLRVHMDLVALGTISDIVPLTGENRILARHGLNQLNATADLGLKKLIEVAGIKGAIDAYEVGFLLGPRLNAAGRLGDALQALELLLTSDEARAREIAVHLDATNRERQDIEKGIVREAMAEIDAWFKPDEHFGIVVGRKGWHPGVIGIVASRITARYYRPGIVIAIENGSGRGSCRSIEGCDLVDRLRQCSDLLVKFGGHTMAAGLEIAEANLAAFKQRFNESVRDVLRGNELRPTQRVDAWLSLGDADQRLFDCMDRMRPFGNGNTTPVWGVRGVSILGKPRTVGQGHLKFTVGSGGAQREAIAFNFGERGVPDGVTDVAFQLKKDSYQGREKLVLNVHDLRVAEDR